MNPRHVDLTGSRRALGLLLALFDLAVAVDLLAPPPSLNSPTFRPLLDLAPEWAWGLIWLAGAAGTGWVVWRRPREWLFRTVFVAGFGIDLMWAVCTLLGGTFNRGGVLLHDVFLLPAACRLVMAGAVDLPRQADGQRGRGHG